MAMIPVSPASTKMPISGPAKIHTAAEMPRQKSTAVRTAARVLGVSQVQVSRLERRAVETLRKLLEAN